MTAAAWPRGLVVVVVVKMNHETSPQ